MSAPNDRLIKAALAAIFSEQQPNDGLWAAGQPIYVVKPKATRSAAAAAFNADPGDAFVFAPDMIGSLLKILPPEYFRPHIAGLERMLAWIESHRKVDVIAQFCDPDSGQCYGAPLVQPPLQIHKT